MARVFFAWELGAGLGHVAQLQPLVKGLCGLGHEVFVAMRDLSKAEFFDGAGALYLQAPHKMPVQGPIETPRTLAHVLWNIGFGESGELAALVEAWTNLFNFVKPDLIVFDHSPTALLAARGREVKRVTIGSGFCCVPDHSPLADLRPELPSAPDAIWRDEQFVLGSANSVLRQRGVQPLERLGQLYGEVDDTFLTTLQEFDHYQDRKKAITQPALTPGPSPATMSTWCPGRGEMGPPGPSPTWPSTAGGRGEVRYRGPWSVTSGEPPVWPAGGGKRIFAYLTPYPGLPKVLQAIREMDCPTILFGRFEQQFQKLFATPKISVAARPVELSRAAAECDVAVLNGGQATTIEFLLAGKPVVLAPIYLEQAINAGNAKRLGAGLTILPRGEERSAERLHELLSNPGYTTAAQRFAACHAGFSATAEIAQAVERLNELAMAD